jgi:hypothetical protein
VYGGLGVNVVGGDVNGDENQDGVRDGNGLLYRTRAELTAAIWHSSSTVRGQCRGISIP